MPTHPTDPHASEASIKARKNLLFEPQSSPAAAPAGPRRPFAEYLRATPPSPLPAATRAILWGVGALVAVLFVATLVFGLVLPRRGRPRPARSEPKTAALPAPASAGQRPLLIVSGRPSTARDL